MLYPLYALPEGKHYAGQKNGEVNKKPLIFAVGHF
jgi:hypothetical protein